MHELRCGSRLHGIVDEDALIEVSCNSNRCGAGPDVMVLHKFTIGGELVSTSKYKKPRRHGAPV